MNVFEWISDLCDELAESGREDLAEKIWNFDTHAHAGRVDLVNAIFPELIAASKSLGLPWIEIYIRHQYMSMRLRMGEGEKALQDTVALFELAHREENKDCPQSVCVTQDLVCCYRRIDVLGYVEECQQVIEETIARIDPSWNCFQCLTGEWADILLRLNRPEEAARYLATQRQEAGKVCDWVQSALLEFQADAAVLCGRTDEALAFVDEHATNEDDPTEQDKLGNAMLRAHVLARGGRFEEAAKLHPPFESVRDIYGGYEDWCETTELLVNAGALANDAAIGQAVNEIMRRFEAGGAYSDTLCTAERLVRLSLKRGAYWTAGRAFETYEAAKKRLRTPEAVMESSLALRKLMEAAPLPPMPVPSDQILSYLRGLPEEDPNADVERGIPWLLQACAERPGDVELHLVAADRMAALNASAEADALLLALTKRLPNEQEPWYALAGQRLNGDNEAAVEQIIRDSAPHFPAVAAFAKATWAYKQERFADCIEASREMLAITSEAPNTRRRMAWAAQRLGDHALAAEQFSVLVAATEEAGSDDWDLAISATILNDADTVKRCCERLQLTVKPDTMPALWPDEDVGICRIIYKDAQGRMIAQVAERTGPVTARIIEVEGPDVEQVYQDVVVFDPRLLNERPDDPEEAQAWYPDFAHVHTLTQGGHRSWVINGVYPGDESWGQLRTALRERSWGLWVRSGTDYVLMHPENEDEALPAVLAFVGVPGATPPSEVAETLTDLTKEWTHPLCWIDLATASGHEVDRHKEIGERYWPESN